MEKASIVFAIVYTILVAAPCMAEYECGWYDWIFGDCTAKNRECECSPSLDGRVDSGCIISKAAPPGYKCRCRFDLAGAKCKSWTLPCNGTADMECVGGRVAHYCACKAVAWPKHYDACDGYRTTASPMKCSKLPKQTAKELQAPRSATCACAGVGWNNCTISKPAPEHFKCVCEDKLGECEAHTEGCLPGEYCPGGDTSHCACVRGQGMTDKIGVCNGYPINQRIPCNFPDPKDEPTTTLKPGYYPF